MDVPVFHIVVLVFHRLEDETPVVSPQDLPKSAEPGLAHAFDDVQTGGCRAGLLLNASSRDVGEHVAVSTIDVSRGRGV